MKIDVVKKDDGDIIFVNTNEVEAMEIIKSLSSQLLSGSPNSGRSEFIDEDGIYFSISVIDNKVAEFNEIKRKYDKQISDMNDLIVKLQCVDVS